MGVYSEVACSGGDVDDGGIYRDLAFIELLKRMSSGDQGQVEK
jgi:hypothetical protein